MLFFDFSCAGSILLKQQDRIGRQSFPLGIFQRVNMAERIIVRIELTPEAKEHIEEMYQRAGMTQLSMISRLVGWFAEADDMVKAAVLGHYPAELKADITKLIAKTLAKPKKTPEARQ